MARIRTIKPEFPQSESMGRISRDARLCFIMLWTIADDSGRLRGNSRMLASLLYPYDDDAPNLIDSWLDEIEREKCIMRYKVDGQHYLQVVNWREHQKIDKPTPSRLPEFANIREDSSSPREDSSEDWKGMEGNGKEGRESARASEPDPASREDTPSPSFSKPEVKTEEVAPLYGKFKNVALSDDDYQGLLFDYGEAKTLEYINRLSSWLAEDSARKCENACAKITHWLIDDKVKPYIHTAAPETRPDPIEKGKGPLDGELAPEVQEAMRAGAFSKAFRGAGPVEIPKLPKSRAPAAAGTR